MNQCHEYPHVTVSENEISHHFSVSIFPLTPNAVVVMFLHRNYRRLAALRGVDALRVAGHRPGLCGVLLPAGSPGCTGTDLVSDAERGVGREPQPLENQPQGCFWNALDPRSVLACADCGDMHGRRRRSQRRLRDTVANKRANGG